MAQTSAYLYTDPNFVFVIQNFNNILSVLVPLMHIAISNFDIHTLFNDFFRSPVEEALSDLLPPLTSAFAATTCFIIIVFAPVWLLF